MNTLARQLGGDLDLLHTICIPAPIRTAYDAGRHTGRLMAELAYLTRALAKATPDEPFDYAAYLAHMGLAQRYGSAKGFVHGYFFDRRSPVSLRTAMDALQKEAAATELAGNLGTAALRSAKLAETAFDRAAMNIAPELALQKVRDCLQAFTGAAEQRLTGEEAEAFLCGHRAQRLRVLFATGAKKQLIATELSRLLAIADTATLPLDLAALYRLQVQSQLLAKNGRLIAKREELREAVERLVRM
ncbi:MAG: hypothetical protein SPL39_03230 [Selenomonadaceae bacterium]|nr:hypothetical protein [Selenomonadaceae bacterium]